MMPISPHLEYVWHLLIVLDNYELYVYIYIYSGYDVCCCLRKSKCLLMCICIYVYDGIRLIARQCTYLVLKLVCFRITMTTPAPYLTRLSATLLLATQDKRVHFYQEKWFQGTSKCGEIIEIQIFSVFFKSIYQNCVQAWRYLAVRFQ